MGGSAALGGSCQRAQVLDPWLRNEVPGLTRLALDANSIVLLESEEADAQVIHGDGGTFENLSARRSILLMLLQEAKDLDVGVLGLTPSAVCASRRARSWGRQ